MLIRQLLQVIEKKGGKAKTFKREKKIAFHGKYLLSHLIYERCATTNTTFEQAIYTFEMEREGYISLKGLYLEVADPTEYEFAQTCFYNYEHFQQLMELKYFRDFIDDCRNELELKLRSQAVLKIKHEAEKGNGAGAITASKYIIERGWIQNKKDRHVLKRRFEQDKKIDAIVSKDLELISLVDVSKRTN